MIINFENLDEEQFICEHGNKFKNLDIYWNFVFCCERGKLTLAKWLLNDCDGYYDDNPRRHGFLSACEYGHLDIARWLAYEEDALVKSSDTTCYDNILSDALRESFVRGHVNVVAWLLSLSESNGEQIVSLNRKTKVIVVENKLNKLLEVLYNAADDCNDAKMLDWLENFVNE